MKEIQYFKDFNEMYAHLRGRVEVIEPEEYVEDVLQTDRPDISTEKPKSGGKGKRSSKVSGNKTGSRKKVQDS